MKRMLFVVFGVLSAALLVTACVTSRAGYETAPCKVVLSDGAFEIRDYPELKIAATQRGKDNESFMRLFRYIDGGNAKQEKIAMTTPVFMAGGTMAFVIPELHRAGTPAPSSSQVRVDTMKAQRVAVHRFSGARTEGSESKALEELRVWMQQRKLREVGKPFSAYYDPPWTPGMLRRNEVLVPVMTVP